MLEFAEKIGAKNFSKLKGLNNSHVLKLVERFVKLCKPSKISVITDDPAEIRYVRQLAIKNNEEQRLKKQGHTVHFDGYNDQARDKSHTAILMPAGRKLSRDINTIERKSGLKEIFDLLDGAMKGKECLVRFFCLGPTNSRFSISALQLTDSAYVAHSEDILYRNGYEQFKRLRGSPDFFTFLHSAGELDERSCTKNIDKRRIYVDFLDQKVYSVNNQYAGNSLGLKKLALRLAIYRANCSNWLVEHMLIMGVHSNSKKRVTYFTGAYPSACGKTSTAMIPGQSIIGDDIAYIRMDDEGNARAVNIESGVFGIIKDVNPMDDPIIYRELTTPRELIFSNVLISNGAPYWQGMGLKHTPTKGMNHSGEWFEGKKDEDGKEILMSHSNARYTMRMNDLENVDPHFNDPEGVIVRGIFYGGRDSDTNVPIFETFNWEHGVYIGATIESETTSATLGKAGIRVSNPMSNIDFLTVPLGTYLTNHIKFGKSLKNCPKVFATNYFLRSNREYLNEKTDKRIWVLWAEGRVHGEYKALETAIGYFPKYDDLKTLFREVLDKDYLEEDYNLQFSIRLDKLIEKMNRMNELFRSEPDMPPEFWKVHKKIKTKLQTLKRKTSKFELPPSHF
jgi:phosphoenolpyruvate carboxykinase (GTP)